MAIEWLRFWHVIVLALIGFCAAGCSADSARFDDDPSRGQPEATGAIASRSARAAGGSWSQEGGTAITVARGDTVDAIARRQHVPASAIIQANNLSSPGAIRPGRRLVIPRYSPSPISVAPEAPRIGAAVLVPPNPIPMSGSAYGNANGSANGSAGVATGAAALTGAPDDTPIKISRPTIKSPVETARAGNIRTHARLSGGHDIVQPGKAASAQPPGRPAPEQPSARKLAVEAPAEKPTGVEPVKATDAPPSAPPITPPSFHWPVRGQVIAGFGPKTDGQRNNGIDIAVPENTPIKAADDGVVIYSGNELKSFGNLVLVRHSNDYITAYAHAKELRVKRGDAIKSGEIIGMSGQTGSDTPQIHFEIRKGTTPVDPMQLLHGA